MVCNHLKELFELCETHQLKIAGPDLIRIVCKQCDKHEVCPSMLMDEYDSRYEDEPTEPQNVQLRTPPARSTSESQDQA
jgi:hypothetical protein